MGLTKELAPFWDHLVSNFLGQGKYLIVFYLSKDEIDSL